jgi:hypothetical protein
LFLTRCLEVFGPEILSSLSFVSTHIDLDVGHTHFNERELAKLIDSAPESLTALVAAGTAALDAYAEFLRDCVALAEQHSSTIRKSFKRRSQFLSWRLQPPPEILAPECSESIRELDFLARLVSGVAATMSAIEIIENGVPCLCIAFLVCKTAERARDHAVNYSLTVVGVLPPGTCSIPGHSRRIVRPGNSAGGHTAGDTEWGKCGFEQ